MTPLAPDSGQFAGATALVVLADAALKGAILLLLAVLASPFLRKASASARHALWCGALAGVLLLPVLSLALPAWRVPWLPEWKSGEQGAGSGEVLTVKNQPPTLKVQSSTLNAQVLANPDQHAANSKETISPLSENRTPADQSVPQSRASALNVKSSALNVKRSNPPSPFDLRPFLWAWLAGSLLAILPLLAGWWQAARLTRRGRALNDAAWNGLLDEVCRELNLRRKIRLLAASGALMPFTWGAWRAVVIFPEAVETWTPERRRLVLLHELGHVKRLDWLTQTLGTLVCALYWFNPLAWMAARQMRFEREQACDDLVLRCGSQPREYARELLEIAAASAQNRILNWVAVPVARHSKLETRLRAILDGTRNRRGLTRLAMLGMLALVAAVVIPMAMLRAADAEKPLPIPPPKSAPTTSTGSPPPAFAPAPVPITAKLYLLETPPGNLDPKTLDLAKIKDLKGVTVLTVRNILATNGQEFSTSVGMISTPPHNSAPAPLLGMRGTTTGLPPVNTFTNAGGAPPGLNSPVAIPAEATMILQPLKLPDGIHYRARFVIHWGSVVLDSLNQPFNQPLISSGGYDAGIEWGVNYLKYTSSDVAAPGRPVIFDLGETADYRRKNVAVLVFDSGTGPSAIVPP